MPLHELLVKVQKELCRSYQKEISEIAKDGPKVKQYCQEYDSYLENCKFKPATESELENAISQASVVLFSDYHSLKADKKQFLKYLQKEVERGEKPVIALECFYPENQKSLDAFLAGKISEKKFLQKTQYSDWGFDWQLYKPIFDFAREHKLRVVGINYRGKQTDEVVAKNISDLDGKVFVLFGEAHLLNSRIPANLEDCVVIHQNPSALYWKFAKKRESAKISRIGKNEYALHLVPPVLKLQSYLNHEEGREELEYGNGISIYGQISEVVKEIGKVLGIKMSDDWLASLTVYTHLDTDAVQKLSRSKNLSKFMTRENLEFIKKQLLAGQSCFISTDDSNAMFLGNLALDEVAEESTHFIHRMCSGYMNGLSEHDAFYAHCLFEALGFLGSKIINPNREFDEKEFQKVFEKSEGAHKMFVAYHLLGYHLGKRLYQALDNDQPGIREAIVKAFKTDLNKPKKAEKIYFELVKSTG